MTHSTSSDVVYVTCPRCGKQSHTRRSNIGKQARCKCGHRFVVAEQHTRTCPACGQLNPDRANRCSVCNADLVLADIYRERDTSNVIAEYETHQQIEDTVHAWYHQRRWRRIGLWLAALTLPLALWGLVSVVRYQTSGTLPTVKQVERDMKLWALPRRPAMLRGRPLTEVPFTDDASHLDVGGPVFSLYLDDAEQVVAFSAQFIDLPTLLERGLPSPPSNRAEARAKLLNLPPGQLSPHALERIQVLSRFADHYLHHESLDPARDPSARMLELDNGNRRTYSWRHGRFSLELTTTIRYQKQFVDDKDWTAIRHCLYIVKGRDW